jgi:hypothetical protein
MNCCKGKCDKYPSLIHLALNYADGDLAYCKTCSKRFYREDCNGYRCFCCNAIIRTSPRWRSKYRIHNTVD